MENNRNIRSKTEYGNGRILKMFFQGIIVGVFAGLISALYRFLIASAEDLVTRAAEFSKENTARALIWLCILAFFGFIVSRITKWEPMASGSGIPQLEGEIKGFFSPRWLKVIAAKIIGGTLSVLSGLSLGREGPSIQLGAMAAKGAAVITKADEKSRLLMTAYGGGAGLAAAFNAPIAGVIFAVEEIHHKIDKSTVCIGAVACITADYVSKLFFGQKTVFSYETELLPLKYYWLFILLGVILGLAGCLYNIVISKSQTLFNKINISKDIKTMIIFVLGGITAIFFPQIIGGGHKMVVLLEESHPGIKMLLVLLLLKFIFSAISFSAGAPGGIFFPLLVLGTYIGAVFAEIAIPAFNLGANFYQEFIVVAMAGIFASIVRAPLTGIILIFEMTGNFDSLLPVAAVSLISYAVANILGVNPIYDILLEKSVNKNVKHPEFGKSVFK